MNRFTCFLGFIVILSGTVVILLNGCSGVKKTGYKGAEYANEFRRIADNTPDSVYLGIEGNLNDDLLLWRNAEVYEKARWRMEKYLITKNNRFEWKVTCGAEINMSQNLYEYFTEEWKYNNECLEWGNMMIHINERGHYGIRPKPGHDPRHHYKRGVPVDSIMKLMRGLPIDSIKK